MDVGVGLALLKLKEGRFTKLDTEKKLVINHAENVLYVMNLVGVNIVGNVIVRMTLEKEPFRMYRSEEEIARDKATSRKISVRLNAEEQRILKELKQMFSLHTDGTALKLSMQVGYNVLHSFLGSKTMRYLTQERRVRELQE